MDSIQTSNKYFCNKCKDKNFLIECACGCEEVIFRYGNNRSLRLYKKYHHMNGQNSFNWNGGIKYSHNYRYIHMPDYFSVQNNGYVAEHIYVFQEYNKCCILPWAEVHHIDPVREGYCNNMPWNLMGLTKAQHRTLDRTKKSDDWKCSKCNEGTYLKHNGRPMWYYDENDKLLCKRCYDKSKWVKKERKKKDWTGTVCYLCGSNETGKSHRGNKDWRKYKNKGVVCSKCYKREYRKNKKEFTVPLRNHPSPAF